MMYDDYQDVDPEVLRIAGLLRGNGQAYEPQHDPGALPEDADVKPFAEWMGKTAQNAVMPEEYWKLLDNFSQENRDAAQQKSMQGLAEYGPLMTLPAAAPMKSIPSIIADSYKMRKAVMNGPVPEYAAIVEGLPGIAQSAWNMAKEGAGKLAKYIPEIKGALPEMEGAVATPATAEVHRPFLFELLGKRGVSIPYVPQSITEPLVLKTEANLVNPLAKQVFGKDLGVPAAGAYTPLWGHGPGDFAPKINQQFMKRELSPAGDLILSTTPTQARTLPHENTHLWEDLIGGHASKGHRPDWQELDAQAKYYWPIHNQPQSVDELLGRNWIPFAESTSDIPSSAFIDQSRAAWNSLKPSQREYFQNRWTSERPNSQRMVNEMVAEMAPYRQIKSPVLTNLDQAYERALNEYPAVNQLVETANKNLNPAWYRTPEDLLREWQKYIPRAGVQTGMGQ